MNKAEMELQAIREKLQSLQADPPLEEDTRLPWSSSSLSSHLAYPSLEPTAEADQNLAQMTTAVETLKQRSKAQLQQFSPPVDASPASVPTPSPPPPTEEDRLLQLNWRRLTTQAQRINQLSQTQEAAILELKAIADQLERDIRKREMLGEPDSYPDDPIPTVCEYESAIVPAIAQDRAGRFILTHRSVDLYQAEREATLTAQALRDRTVSRNLAFDGLDSLPDLGLSCLIEEPIGFIQTIWNKCSAQLKPLFTPSPRRPSRRSKSRHRSPGMSWLDAMIWFSSATILRLGLDFLLTAYPALWPPVLALVLALVAIALYQTAFAPRADFSLGYRLLVAIAGLIVGGRL